MIQPNFSELEWRLQRAIDLVQSSPEATSSRAYGQRLQASLGSFRRVNVETDVTYNRWRDTRGDQMRAFRQLRRELDRLRELADEHALDEFPQTRITYTDEEELIAFTNEVIAFLTPHGELWKWIPVGIQTLNDGLSAAKALKTREAAEFQKYTLAGKIRVASYDDAFGLYRDFVRDARNDLGHLPAYEPLRLRVD